jgi:HEPN domain-containing protein
MEYASMDKQMNTPREWRTLADRDLLVADHLAATMVPVPAEIIAFHCQQAVEKYLKGSLVFLGAEPPYIHDLDKLCSLAEKRLSSFSTISSLCVAINYFSVQPRYDLGISLSETDMRLVHQQTKEIRDFLQREIPELFQEDVDNGDMAFQT